MSFGSEKKTLESDRPEEQSAVGKQLGSWLSQYLGKYEPGKKYEGELTAPMSAQERAGMDYLNQYLGAPTTGPLYEAGKKELLGTLEGSTYDPAKGLFYKGLRDTALLNEEDVINRQRRGAGYRGAIFQDTSLRDETRARTETGNYLNQLLGGLYEKERERKLSATDKALEYEKYGQAAPLAKVSAATTFGSLPRLIQQADYEAQYKDFLRKQQELAGVTGAAQSYYQTQGPNYGLREYETASPFERIMGTIAPVAGTVLGSALGPGGAWAGGKIASTAASGIKSIDEGAWGEYLKSRS